MKNYTDYELQIGTPISEDVLQYFASVATPREDVLEILRITSKEADDWCWEKFRMPFRDYYGILIKGAILEYKQALSIIAASGNSTAIQTMNKVLMDMNDQSDYNITINANVPKEDEDNNAN